MSNIKISQRPVRDGVVLTIASYLPIIFVWVIQISNSDKDFDFSGAFINGDIVINSFPILVSSVYLLLVIKNDQTQKLGIQFYPRVRVFAQC